MRNRNHAYLLPSLLTLGNLLCGLLAIHLACNHQWPHAPLLASLLILVAMLLDGFDGLVARRLGVASEFGAQLDSLADVVTFGVAPVMLLTQVCQPANPALLAVGAWWLCCTALRLARFNAAPAEEHDGGFEGLPSPAAGATVACFVVAWRALLGDTPVDMHESIQRVTRLLLPAMALGLGGLMVSNIHYPRLSAGALWRPMRFQPLIAICMTAAAMVAVKGYAPLLICVLFVALPVWAPVVLGDEAPEAPEPGGAPE